MVLLFLLLLVLLALIAGGDIVGGAFAVDVAVGGVIVMTMIHDCH